MPLRDVSIVIPSWNGRALLERYLPSVVDAADHYRCHTGSAAEVIVVEDGGSDRTPEWLRENYGDQVICLRRPVQGGFARACNSGLAQARGPIVLLLNNDVSISKDALTQLLPHFDDADLFAVTCRALEASSDVVTSGGRIGRFRKGFWRVYQNYDVTEAASTEPSEYPSILASGGFSAVDLEKVRKLGGFRPLLSPFYWEDVELSLRAWHRGWKILYEPRAEVRHAASSTIGSTFGPDEVRRISERNRLIVHWIHVHEPSRLLQHLLGMIGLLLASVFKFDRATLRGFRDALGEWPEVLRLRAEERKDRILGDGELESIFYRMRQRPDLTFFSSREEFLSSRRRHGAVVNTRDLG